MGNDYRSRESDSGRWYYSDENRYIPQSMAEKAQRRRSRQMHRNAAPYPRPANRIAAGQLPFHNPNEQIDGNIHNAPPSNHLPAEQAENRSFEQHDAPTESRAARVVGTVFVVSLALLIIFVAIAVILFMQPKA